MIPTNHVLVAQNFLQGALEHLQAARAELKERPLGDEAVYSLDQAVSLTVGVHQQTNFVLEKLRAG